MMQWSIQTSLKIWVSCDSVGDYNSWLFSKFVAFSGKEALDKTGKEKLVEGIMIIEEMTKKEGQSTTIYMLTGYISLLFPRPQLWNIFHYNPVSCIWKPAVPLHVPCKWWEETRYCVCTCTGAYYPHVLSPQYYMANWTDRVRIQ